MLRKRGYEGNRDDRDVGIAGARIADWDWKMRVKVTLVRNADSDMNVDEVFTG